MLLNAILNVHLHCCHACYAKALWAGCPGLPSALDAVSRCLNACKKPSAHPIFMTDTSQNSFAHQQHPWRSSVLETHHHH